MELAQRLAEIKDALRRVTGRPADASAYATGRGVLPTGWRALDELCGGGLPRGRLSELVGACSSGKTALALAAAAHATGHGHLVAYVDARRELYPPSAAALGVALERLLVVRPPAAPRAVGRAGEILAGSRAFALVLLDLPDDARLDPAVAARLRAAAHDGAAAVVILTSRRSTEDAHLRLQAVAARPGPAATTPARRLGSIPGGEAPDRRRLRLELSARSPAGRARAEEPGAPSSGPPATPAPGLRRVEVTVLRGGTAPPGTCAEVILTSPSRLVSTSFRPPDQRAALLEAAPRGPLLVRASRAPGREEGPR